MSHVMRRTADNARMAAIGLGLRILGLPSVRRRALECLDHCGMILMFHHVGPPRTDRLPVNEGLEITPQTLDWVLCSLKAQNYDIVSMDEVAERFACGAHRKKRFAALTFDDGGRDNLLHAAPVLARHAAPFTIYVTTDFASGLMAPWWHVVERATMAASCLAVETDVGIRVFDTSNKWKKIQTAKALHCILWRSPEQRRAQETIALARQAGLDLCALAHELFMDWTELGEVAALPGCTIGAHTKSHPKLAHLDEAGAKREISEGRDTLRHRLGVKVDHFSYPYGGAGTCDAREFALIGAEGFSTAVTTRKNILNPTDAHGLMNLPRGPINGHFQHPAMIDALVCGLPMVLSHMDLRTKRVGQGAEVMSVPG